MIEQQLEELMSTLSAPVNRPGYLSDTSYILGAGIIFLLLFTEARTPQFMMQLRDAIQTALTDAIPEEDDAPWILQVYVQDEPSLHRSAIRRRRLDVILWKLTTPVSIVHPDLHSRAGAQTIAQWIIVSPIRNIDEL